MTTDNKEKQERKKEMDLSCFANRGLFSMRIMKWGLILMGVILLVIGIAQIRADIVNYGILCLAMSVGCFFYGIFVYGRVVKQKKAEKKAARSAARDNRRVRKQGA